MVYLTITDAILEALQFCILHHTSDLHLHSAQGEPDLGQPTIDGPISHRQVISLSKCIRTHQKRLKESGELEGIKFPAHSIELLLHNTIVYREPPPAAPEKSLEFQALMDKLRIDEETASYRRMLASQSTKSIPRRDRNAPQLFGSTGPEEFERDDEVTYADVNRQLTLIINIMVSIVACSVAIWIAARHQSTPTRLFLSMGGSGLVGLAEVVVYAGYLRRVGESKQRELNKQESKEIIDTWVTKNNGVQESQEVAPSKQLDKGVRRRKFTTS